MANVTLSIDDVLLRRARKIAMEKNTSVNALVREHLREVVSAEQHKGDILAEQFLASVKKFKIRSWNKPVSRDDLYER